MKWVELLESTDPPPLPDLHPLVSRALLQRGIHTPEAAWAFLDPDRYSPVPATDIPGLAEAVERTLQAIRHHLPICVWGDFDVDGQTSTTILVQTLHDLGAEVSYHIPVREKESHGVNIPMLNQVIDTGVRFILTCDTGISALQAADFAHRRGVELVITDHHDLPEQLPAAAAITNPKFLPEGHALATLSGSGLAYKLAEELYTRSGRAGEAEALMDLAALGLVADVAGLTGEARYIVQRGIQLLRNSQRPGLQALFEFARLNPDHLTEEHISFEIAPRLNALGRLSDANPAVEFFTTSDAKRAAVLANVLEGLNIQRQSLCTQVQRAAEAKIKEKPELLEQPMLLLEGPNWPGGVIGIVASHLVERYHKPTILLTLAPGEPARGSARSVEGFNITAAIARQSDLLLGFGGHPMAAGLSLETDKLPQFRVRLQKTAETMIGSIPEESQLPISAWMGLEELNLDLVHAIETLAPFGPGNEKLVLATREVTLVSAAKIGHTKEHLKLTVRDEAENTQDVLWWGGAEAELPEGRFDLAYTLRASDWRGASQLQMELVDIRLVEPEKIEVHGPETEVVDLRQAPNPAAALESLRSQASTVIWAEGDAKKSVGGCDRNELVEAAQLVIWTTPASPKELAAALEVVRPRKVFLLAVNGREQTPEAFLSRLAGLVKYVLHERGGRVSWEELAAATAEKATSVRAGLEWLEARGQVRVHVDAEAGLSLSAGTGERDQAAMQCCMETLCSLLEETAAYRAYFQGTEKEDLLPKHEKLKN